MTDFGGALWVLVVLDSALLIGFAATLFRPQTRRDWRVMGSFSAFVVALFAEMYGFPLTIYVLSGWLGTAVPQLAATHAGGHLLNDLIGWAGDPHLSPFHLLSYVLMGGAFILLARSWPVLWRAQRAGELAVSGPYGHVRHPQYDGFILLMTGLLVQWPTLITLAMFPVLAVAYRRLALTEEREMHSQFGLRYEAYSAATPRFLPRLVRRRPAA
jgi:protein-S-isoprenylcysteine O-methyltransferase Ste14